MRIGCLAIVGLTGLLTTGGPATALVGWQGFGGPGNGCNGTVRSTARRSNGDLLVVGDFSACGDVVADSVAQWSPVDDRWTAPTGGVGAAVRGEIHAVAEYQGEIYVGGRFDTIGGETVRAVARWDGSAWRRLGTGLSSLGAISTVRALVVHEDALYVAGSFGNAGGQPARGIARWDGQQWGVLPQNDATLDYTALLSAPQGLYAAVDGVMLWQQGRVSLLANSTWATLGTPFSGPVNALALRGTELYAGGSFTVASGAAAGGLARWDGAQWQPVIGAGGERVQGSVAALAATAGTLYVGGDLDGSVGVDANGVARWDGASWTTLGSPGADGVDQTVLSLSVLSDELLVGGELERAGATSVSAIARWNGQDWLALDARPRLGLDAAALQAASDGQGGIYVAGALRKAGTVRTPGVAFWNGQAWSALGSGLDGIATSLALTGSQVWVGGTLTRAGSAPAAGLARWDGSQWFAPPSPQPALSAVHAIAASDTDLYVAGSEGRVLHWNGQQWTQLGPSGPFFFRLAFSGQDLYVGGNFLEIAGEQAIGVARWDGKFWRALGNGSGPQPVWVDALHVDDLGRIHAAGDFQPTQPNTARVGRFSGTGWQLLGGTFYRGSNRALNLRLHTMDGTLYVAGDFDRVDTQAIAGVARWDGSRWQPLGDGIPGSPRFLTSSEGRLYVVGLFGRAGGELSSHIAVWNEEALLTDSFESP